ncbi:hypothetical protein MKX53_13145 [Psychrobacillus sp. FSL K6-4615]|uniref:hypothetical protein n=1 Tax=Psychrobacillus sp. FSL K6-4615 TaxID=2921551 RepID=UPI0030FCDA60
MKKKSKVIVKLGGNMKKLKVSICLLIVCISFPFAAYAFYGEVEGGTLLFDAGQNDTKIHSRIQDNLHNLNAYVVDDGKNFAVTASVKVGSTTHTSDWKIAEASIAANRVWYANESSHYNFKSISTKYTNQNWGTNY